MLVRVNAIKVESLLEHSRLSPVDNNNQGNVR